MSLGQYLLLGIFLIAQISCQGLQSQESNLEFVIQMCRHGARAPMWPTVDYQQWKTQKQMLTTNGVRQHYLIGRMLRKELIQEAKLLSSEYQYAESTLYSTDAPRTMMSAQAQMMGLYDQSLPKVHKQFDKSTDYPQISHSGFRKIIYFLQHRGLPQSMQPVPVYPRNDYVFNPDDHCPRIDQENDLFLNTPEYKDFEAQLQANGFYTRFSAVFPNEQNLNVQTVGRYYDTLNCDLYEGRRFPKGLTDDLLNEMIFIYDWEHLRRYYPNDLTTKLYASPLLNELYAKLDQIRQQPNDPIQFILYSTSDTQLKYVMMGLGLLTYTADFDTWSQQDTHYLYNSPEFASTLFFKLFQKSTITGTELYINIVYNGQEIELAQCKSQNCPLDQFLSILKSKSFTQSEWESNCNN